MFIKVLNSLKNNGITETVANILNFFLVKVLGVRIIKSNKTVYNAGKIFDNRKLIESDDGFFYVDPMPTNEELNKYYATVYWDARSGKEYGASTRDFIHWNILQEYIGEFLNRKELTIMNFWAGHGGISNIFWLQGHNVVNVEPSGLPDFYNERWNVFNHIKDVSSSSIDIIYGSHSLEHVQDIKEFEAEIKRVLRKENYVFWEVPNAANPGNGAMKGQIDIPHTYYFKKDYFDYSFDEVLLNCAYDQKENINIQDWKKYRNDRGHVLRALGRYLNLG